MKRLLLFIVLLNNLQIAKAQFTPTIVGTFPSILSETSGLEVNDSLTLWTHNDSGGEDRIYLVNHSAQILDSFDIINANNKPIPAICAYSRNFSFGFLPVIIS